jgi:hypothetical protein
VAGRNDLTLRCAPPLHIRVGLPVHTDAVSAVEDVRRELSEIDAGAAIVEHRSLVVDGELKDASKRTQEKREITESVEGSEEKAGYRRRTLRAP